LRRGRGGGDDAGRLLSGGRDGGLRGSLHGRENDGGLSAGSQRLRLYRRHPSQGRFKTHISNAQARNRQTTYRPPTEHPYCNAPSRGASVAAASMAMSTASAGRPRGEDTDRAPKPHATHPTFGLRSYHRTTDSNTIKRRRRGFVSTHVHTRTCSVLKRRGVGHDVAGCGTAAGCHQWRRRCGRARVRIGGSHLRFTIFGTHTMCPQTLISDRRIASTATAGLSLPTNRLRTRTGHVWLRTRPGIERQPLRLDVVKVVEAGVRKGGGTDERRCEAAVLLVAQRCRNTAKRCRNTIPYHRRIWINWV